MHLWKHMLVCIKMQICRSLFWTRVGRSSEVLFLLALLLSAEVGVAPRLLQPADFADEYFFFPFLLVLNLRGSYLYGVRLVPLGTPPRQGPSQQNISSPWRGSGTVALMEGRGELRGLAAGCGIVNTSPAPPHTGCYQPRCGLPVFRHSFIYVFSPGRGGKGPRGGSMQQLGDNRLLEVERAHISDLVILFWGSFVASWCIEMMAQTCFFMALLLYKSHVDANYNVKALLIHTIRNCIFKGVPEATLMCRLLWPSVSHPWTWHEKARSSHSDL